jgi:hypothetical protein
MKGGAPRRIVRYCGADCGSCGTYQRFLTGDESDVVNSQTGYRCCWLPEGYPEGRDCPIKQCCEAEGVLYCGMCSEMERCTRMDAFYSQPGYDALKQRMLREVERVRQQTRRGPRASEANPGA